MKTRGTTTVSLVLFLYWSSLLIDLQICKGAGTYSISSRVFPDEAKRQGIRQENPCPGDRVVLTCIRSETPTVPIAVRWTANGIPLYTFGIPRDIGTPRANQEAGFPGLIGTLVDATTLTLLVDLTISRDISNGTDIVCDEVTSGITSPKFTLFITGVASAPAMISLDPAGFTGIYVNVTIPNSGSICVDEYRASISGIPTGISSLTQVVTDVAQTVYRFRFAVDLCSDLLTGVRATALAITDGVTGPSLTVEAPTDTLNRSDLITSVFMSQQFTSSGIMFTLINDLVDPNLRNMFNITCDIIESPVLLDCKENTIGTPSISEKTILFPYDAGLTDNIVSFRLAYSYRLCGDNEVINLSVKPVNSSVSQVIQGARAVSIEFDETIFDANSVRVNFTSNCTSSVTVGYSNPLMVTIPDTRLNTGQCQYNVQLVNSNSQQIGYPVLGFFVIEELPVFAEVSGASTVGAVVGVLLAAALLIAAVIVTSIVVYTMYIKKRTIVYNTGSKTDHEKRLAASSTTEQLVDGECTSTAKYSEMTSYNSSSNSGQPHPSLGIFNEDLEDLTEGIFTSAYTELSNADAGTRISFSSVPKVSPSLGLKVGHDRRDVAAARKPRPPTRKTATLQVIDDDADEIDVQYNY